MQTSEKQKFLELLTLAMGAYSKPLPEPELIKVWWALLAPFPLVVVQAAFTQYRRRDSKFAPVPAGIEQICINSDGRPDDEEAWTVSLTALDETETVVWTEEMEAAFWIAHPALEGGDHVGARMSFKQTYNRLVAEARAIRKPVKWQITPGKNQQRYSIVYARAIELGRLPTPEKDSNAALLLEGPKVEGKGTPEGLLRLKEHVAKLRPASEKLAEIRAAELLSTRLDAESKKAEIARQVEEYERSKLAVKQ